MTTLKAKFIGRTVHLTSKWSLNLMSFSNPSNNATLSLAGGWKQLMKVHSGEFGISCA